MQHTENVYFKMADADTVDTGDGPKVNIERLSQKAYSFLRDGSAAFTGNLMGRTISGANTVGNEEVIVSLAAGAQGSIPDHINEVWISATAGGLLGADTKLRVTGQEEW